MAQSYISIVLAYIQGNNVAHGLKQGNTCKLPVLFSWAIQVISVLLRIHLFRFSELQNLLTVKKLGLVENLFETEVACKRYKVRRLVVV